MSGIDSPHLSQALSPDLAGFYGKITDPNKHHANNFRYLVHGFNPMNLYTQMHMMGLEIQDQKNGISNDKGDGDQSIDIYDEPFRVGERVSVSMSLIDQNHIGTWGNAGLILGVPEKNIVRTATKDVGVLNYCKSRLLELKRQHVILDGDQVLEFSAPECYNEIVGLAKTDEGVVKVIGFFAKVDEDGEYIDTISAIDMENHARNAGLPLVKLPASLDFNNSEVISNDTYPCIFNYLGKKYYLSSPNKPASIKADAIFCKRSSNNKYNFLEEAELHSILDILGKEFPEVLAELGTKDEILEEYVKSKKLYYAPKFERDGNGKIKMIRFVRGTGKNKTLYTIGALSAMKVNADRELEHITKSMRWGLEMELIDDNLYIYIGFEEVQNELKLYLEEMGEEPRVEVIQFLENSRDNIESFYKSHGASRRAMNVLDRS